MSPHSIRNQVWDQVRQKGLGAFTLILTESVVAAALQMAGIPPGTGPLNQFTAAWLALASALYRLDNFQKVLDHVVTTLEDGPQAHHALVGQARSASVPTPVCKQRGDPRSYKPLTLTEEAFTQARQLLPWRFWIALIVILTERFERQHSAWVHYKSFRLLALDGTCIKLARWKHLRSWFGTCSNGKGQPVTMARLVLLQFPLARMPWRYELVPMTESEKTVAVRLLAHLRPHDLVLMDRGFFSYGLFWQIVKAEAHFGTRLKSQVKFRTVETLSDGSQLVDWSPVDYPKKWKKTGLPATIRLRVINYQIRGFRPSAVVTSVLDPEELSAEEWVRMAVADRKGRMLEAAGLCHRRWEIETSFAELKEVQGLEQSLRSRTPEGIVFEVAGHMLLYLGVRWLMVLAAEAAGVDPLRLSFSEALAAVRGMAAGLILSSRRRVETVLIPRLLARMARHRVPFRPGREFPRRTSNKYKTRGQRRKKEDKPCPMVPSEQVAA